jgi:starch synthase
VLCAGAPDTPEIAKETERAVAELAAARPGVVWVRGMLPAEDVRSLLAAATVFVCPSVYEPLGIVNLEAMACGTAVVASDVGGIPEVVADGRTGLLVHFDEHHVDKFRDGLADAVNTLLADPATATAMGTAGRERAEREFTWQHAAARTVEIYRSLI